MSDTVHACPRTQCITQPTHILLSLSGAERRTEGERRDKSTKGRETNQTHPHKKNYRACWPGGQAQTNRTPILQLLRVVGREEEETEEGVEGRRRRHLQLGTIEAIAVRHANAKAPHPRTTHLLLTPDTHLLRKVTQHIIGTSQRLERKPRGKKGP
jgi:hypothetical protein